MRKNISFFLVLALSLFGEKTDILFHLHDAGETLALLPVIKRLQVDYLILATGTAEKLVPQHGILLEKIRSWADLEAIEPKEVVTGVANELQGLVLDHFNQKGIPTLAFWDNFNAEGESPYFQTAHSVGSRAHILLLPCQALVAAFPDRDVRVVGQPTLDRPVRKKIAVWIGGYGKEYEEAYRLFQEGAATVDDITFLIQHHPKTGLPNLFSLAQLFSFVDLVICHQSTASFQALAAQVPVLHVIPPGQTYSSLPLQKGVVSQVHSVAEFSAAVHRALETPVDDFFALMGIPENSTESCQKVLLDTLP